MKISKSKGGATPFPELMKTTSPDALRVYYCNFAEYASDMAWEPLKVHEYQEHLETVEGAIGELIENHTLSEKIGDLEIFLGTLLVHAVYELGVKSCELLDLKKNSQFFSFRKSSQIPIYTLFEETRWWKTHGVPIHPEIVKIWIETLYPYAPFMCERLWKKLTGLKGIEQFAQERCESPVAKLFKGQDLDLGIDLLALVKMFDRLYHKRKSLPKYREKKINKITIMSPKLLLVLEKLENCFGRCFRHDNSGTLKALMVNFLASQYHTEVLFSEEVSEVLSKKLDKTGLILLFEYES